MCPNLEIETLGRSMRSKAMRGCSFPRRSSTMCCSSLASTPCWIPQVSTTDARMASSNNNISLSRYRLWDTTCRCCEPISVRSCCPWLFYQTLCQGCMQRDSTYNAVSGSSNILLNSLANTLPRVLDSLSMVEICAVDRRHLSRIGHPMMRTFLGTMPTLSMSLGFKTYR
jgi:hypothetical protein